MAIKKWENEKMKPFSGIFHWCDWLHIFPDILPRYYGVIIVRTLLFLAGLIWMQHLMVRRLIAVETTSRRRLAGRRAPVRDGLVLWMWI